VRHDRLYYVPHRGYRQGITAIPAAAYVCRACVHKITCRFISCALTGAGGTWPRGFRQAWAKTPPRQAADMGNACVPLQKWLKTWHWQSSARQSAACPPRSTSTDCQAAIASHEGTARQRTAEQAEARARKTLGPQIGDRRLESERGERHAPRKKPPGAR